MLNLSSSNVAFFPHPTHLRHLYAPMIPGMENKVKSVEKRIALDKNEDELENELASLMRIK